MSRQHATPLIISAEGNEIAAVVPLALGIGGHGIPEAVIQEMVHLHPICLPIAEIGPLFVNPIPRSRRVQALAGPRREPRGHRG